MVPLGLPSARSMAQTLRLRFEYYIYYINFYNNNNIIIIIIIQKKYNYNNYYFDHKKSLKTRSQIHNCQGKKFHATIYNIIGIMAMPEGIYISFYLRVHVEL